MIPHVYVHRRRNNKRRGRRKMKCGKEIVRNTAREFRNDVRSRWSNEKQIRPLRNGDVFDRAFEVCLSARFRKKVRDYLLSGKRGKSQRSDEFPGRLRHHDLHTKSILLKPAHQLRGFVCRNSSGDAKRDAHGGTPQRLISFSCRRCLRRLQDRGIRIRADRSQSLHKPGVCTSACADYPRAAALLPSTAGRGGPQARHKQTGSPGLSSARSSQSFPPNDARRFSTRVRRRTLEHRSAITIASTSRPARSTSSFTTQ